MTRSILCGLFGLISVVTLGTLPVACQSGGVGDPCTPEDEYNPDFAGFKVTEENIESRSFQCATRICLVNHFQGRVSCPLGQKPVGADRKACNGLKDTSTCGQGSECVEASTLAPDCDPKNKDGKDADCASVPGTVCDTAKKLCTCVSGGQVPPGYFCGLDSGGDNILKSYICHVKNNCQVATVDNDPNKNNRDKNGNPKDCCIPGTDTPVQASVCGQCNQKTSTRNANKAVYCSCRCDVATGETKDPNFNYCTCPTGFSCEEIRKDVGLGDPQITGKYCIQEGTKFSGNAFDCGEVSGNFDTTCRGSAAPPGK